MYVLKIRKNETFQKKKQFTKQKPDVPDNFKKYKTKSIPKNIILSKSKYDLKTK